MNTLFKNRLISCFIFTISCLTLWSQQGAENQYYIVGDHVNIRTDTLLTSVPFTQWNWGRPLEKVWKVSANWFAMPDELLDDTFYISSKYLANKEQFYKMAMAKQNKNGVTKFILFKIKIEKKDKTDFDKLAFELMDNYKEDIPTIHEDCTPIYTSAYFLYVNSGMNTNEFLIQKVLDYAQDSTVQALALIDGIKVDILKNQAEKGIDKVISLVDNYLNFLLLPGCDYSTYSSSFPILEAKNMIFVLFQFLNYNEIIRLRNYFISNITPNKSFKSDFSKDILRVVNDGIWDQHLEYQR